MHTQFLERGWEPWEKEPEGKARPLAPSSGCCLMGKLLGFIRTALTLQQLRVCEYR